MAGADFQVRVPPEATVAGYSGRPHLSVPMRSAMAYDSVSSITAREPDADYTPIISANTNPSRSTTSPGCMSMGWVKAGES